MEESKVERAVQKQKEQNGQNNSQLDFFEIKQNKQKLT